MKDNKLIAEFMGVVFHDDKNQYYNADGLYIGLELQYHTSWDWLMPVVEKIHRNYNVSIDIGHEWVEVRGYLKRVFLYDKTINLTYKSVIYVINEIKQR